MIRSSDPRHDRSGDYSRGDLIAQLEPDLIGEHHVGLIADEELLDGCLAWIAAEADEGQRFAATDEKASLINAQAGFGCALLRR